MVSVFILCNPLMDKISHVSHEWLADLEAVPGSMNLVDRDRIDLVLGENPQYTPMPGGSGANTARGLAWLAGPDSEVGKPVFLGAVGSDGEAREFRELLERAGVGSALVAKEGEATGVSAVLVTPERERTMFTFLGASRLLTSEDLPLELIGQSRFLYLTGYNWDTENQRRAAELASKVAKRKGSQVCLDLADPFVADRYRERLLSWIPGEVDIIFANRDELWSLTEGNSDEEVLRAATALVPLVVMKTGKEGCAVLQRGGDILRIPGEKVEARDSTAAGDSFAAGFLYGLLRGRSLRDCGRLANRLASRMVTVEGCNYDLLDRAEILQILD